MLTLYVLTGVGFAALTAIRCLKTDESAEDYIATGIASLVSGIVWPGVLAAMIVREVSE